MVSVWAPHVARPFFSDPDTWMIAPLAIAKAMEKLDGALTWYPLEQGPADQTVYYIVRAGERSEFVGRFLQFLAQILTETDGIHLLVGKEQKPG